VATSIRPIGFVCSLNKKRMVHPLKIRITTLSLTILCLALTAYAGTTTFYNDGGIDGQSGVNWVGGPLYGYQDISNGFVAAASGTPNTLEWGEWSVGAPTSFSYELGSAAFGTDLGSGTVAQNAGNSTFLFTNNQGFSVYDVKVGITSLAMTAGNTYWLSISNATGINQDTQGWDIPNGGLGGPATCNFRLSGTNYDDCGSGGDSFTLTGSTPGTTPEPSSILLFGSGILGLAGVLRRKLTR
jgi:PEP-CTERM motif